MTQSKPSEYNISETWDRCIEATLLNTSIAILGGGAAAFLLFRGNTARSFVTGLSGGTGIGLSWNKCEKAFEEAGLTTRALPQKQKPTSISEELKE